MPQPYSMDLRTRVVAAARQQTQEQVAARFAVSACDRAPVVPPGARRG